MPGQHSSEENVAAVASRYRRCDDLTSSGIKPQTSGTDNVRSTTELTGRLFGVFQLNRPTVEPIITPFYFNQLEILLSLCKRSSVQLFCILAISYRMSALGKRNFLLCDILKFLTTKRLFYRQHPTMSKKS